MLTGCTTSKLKSQMLSFLCILSLCSSLSLSSVVAQTTVWSLLGLKDLEITSLVVDPSNPLLLYAGAGFNGFYRSQDGGATWNLSSMGLNGQHASTIAIDPVTPSRLYVGTGGGLYYSTNSGTSWTASNIIFTVNEVVVSPSRPATVYAATSVGVYRSDDSGQTWTLVGLQQSIVGALAIDPGNSSTVYAGGSSDGILRSADAGVTWSRADGGNIAGYVTSIAVNPTSPQIIYAGSSSGVYRSLDGGATFATTESAATLQATTSLVMNPADPSTIYASDGEAFLGLYRSVDGGLTWATDGLTSEHVRAVAFNPTGSPMYAGTNIGVYRSSRAPVISEQPLNQRVRPGRAVTLDVIAGAGGPVSYQWYRGESSDISQAIPGATARTYTTPPLNGDTAFWVRLGNAAGSTDSRTARVSIKGPYDVALDGFNSQGSFDNFGYTPGDAIPGASWEIFKRTFPATRMETANGQPTAGARAYFRGPTYRTVGGGNCFGMAAVSTLRYLDAPESVEREVLNPYFRRFTQVGDLPPTMQGNVRVGQSNVKDYIFLYQGRQNSVQIQGWLSRQAQATPAQTFDTIRQITQAGNVAILVFWYQYPDQQWAGHAVVAYGTSQSGNSALIAIYDPNWPGDSTRRLSVDLTPGQERWSYELWAGTIWSGQRDLRYLPVNMLSPAFVDLQGRQATPLLADEQGLTLAVEGEVDLLITDSQGRQFGTVDLEPTQEISGAARIVNVSFDPDNPGARSSEAYYLLAGQPYTVTVRLPTGDGPNLAASVPYTLTTFGDGSAMSIGGASLSGAANDTLVLSGAVRDATFTPATDGDYCQALTDEISAENSREYRACVIDGAGVGARFAIDEATGTFRVENVGGKAFNAAITTTQVGANPGSGSSSSTLPPGGSQVAPDPRSRVYLPLLAR